MKQTLTEVVGKIFVVSKADPDASSVSRCSLGRKPPSTRWCHACPHRKSTTFSELREAQRVAIRVFEPRYHRTTGRLPDAVLVLYHPRIAFENYVVLLEAFRCADDVLHLPSQDGVCRRREFLNSGDSQHRAADVEHERKLIPAHQLQSESVAIARPCADRIAGSDKSHELLQCRAALRRHGRCSGFIGFSLVMPQYPAGGRRRRIGFTP